MLPPGAEIVLSNLTSADVQSNRLVVDIPDLRCCVYYNMSEVLDVFFVIE